VALISRSWSFLARALLAFEVAKVLASTACRADQFVELVGAGIDGRLPSAKKLGEYAHREAADRDGEYERPVPAPL
jgi:hypothetical protein